MNHSDRQHELAVKSVRFHWKIGRRSSTVKSGKVIIRVILVAMLIFSTQAAAMESVTASEASVAERGIVSIDPPEVYPESTLRLRPLAGPSVQIIRITTGQGLGHTSVAVGGYNDNISMAISGATAVGTEWSSSNRNIFTVTGNMNTNVATISAIAEGFARLRLHVNTADGDVLTDEANVSIYTPLAEDAAGRVTSAADVYRGADGITTHRGQVAAGQRLTIVGQCGSWYYALFPDSVSFTDDQPANHYGYLLKSKVTFPVTGIRVSPKSLSLNKGETATLSSEVMPGYASDKKVTWSTGNAKIATVSANGKVTAKATGTTTITAKTSDGGRTDSCVIAVKLPAPAISAIKSGGNLKVTTTWNVVAGTASYTLLYATEENGTYKVAKAGIQSAAKAKTVTATHAAPGYKVFYYRVVAVHANTSCNSDRSVVKSFNTLLPPAGLSGDSNGSSITITWKKALGATGYVVYRASEAKGTYEKIKTIKKGKGEKVLVTYKDKKIASNKIYYYQVRSLRAIAAKKAIQSLSSENLSYLNALRLSWPVSGKVSSEFGYREHPVTHDKKFHKGIDISVAKNTPVKAAAYGTVVSAGWAGGYGNYIIIDHGNGIRTCYAHNDRFNAKVNDKVKSGQVIAFADSTGMSTGNHCHFEVKEGRNFVNPRGYLETKNG